MSRTEAHVIGGEVPAALSDDRRLGPRERLAILMGSNWTIRVLMAVVFFSAWQLFGDRSSTVTFATPARTLEALEEMTVDGRLWDAWRADILIMATALAISAVFGVLLGFVLGRYRTLDQLIEPISNGIFMTPKIALLPIIALWLGFQFEAKVLVVVMFSFFEVMFTVRSGVRVTDAAYIDVARAYVIPERMMLRKIIAPATIPYIITALRLGLLHGLVGVVLAGFFLENIGIGGLISNETSEFNIDTTFAAMITVMVVGISINLALRVLERSIAPWAETRTS